MDVDRTLLELLPAWIAYTRLIVTPPTALLASLGSSYLAGRLMLPAPARLEALHWSLRARAVAPARYVVGVMFLTSPIFCGFFASASSGPWNGLPAAMIALLGGLSGLLGGAIGAAAIDARATGRVVAWPRWLTSRLLAYVFMCPQLGIVLAMLILIDTDLDGIGLTGLVAGSAGLLLASRYSGLPLARLLGVVQPATPRLERLVRETRDRLGIPVRSVEQIDLEMANAFAIPGAQRLVFTSQLERALDDDALRSVIAHELGHLRDHPVARAMMLGWLSFLPLGAMRLIWGQWGLLGFGLAYAGVLLTLRLATRLGRHAEHAADDVAVSGELDGVHYARALETLYRLNLSPAVTRPTASHPSLYDRIRAAGIEPDFPRPAPPSGVRTALGLIAASLLMAALTLLPWLSPALVAASSEPSEPAALVQLALSGPKPSLIFELAQVRQLEGGDAGRAAALALLDQALEIDAERHAHHALRAALLAEGDRCELAWPAFRRAVETTSEGHFERCHWITRAAEALSGCDETLAGD